ncbi:MAG: CvpA family protein [Cytophagales bacterium]|nr:MAG: CvpA family protein [Cytophagales bacterium]
MIVDTLILIVLAIGGYFGFKKGFLIEIISVLAFIIATMTAFKLLNTTIGFLKPYIDQKSATPVLAFIGVFIGVFFLIFLLGKFLTNMLRYTLFGSFDKFAGAITGLVKYMFFLSVIFWLLHISGLNKMYSNHLKGTLVYPYVLVFAKKFLLWVSYVIPFSDVFESIRKLL